MPETCIAVRDLTYKVQGQTLLDIAALDIPMGGPTVILGPNGAGKSVFLRLLHGLLTPTGGSISFPGKNTSEPRQSLVFQKPVILRRSVAANIRFALAAAGRRRAGASDLLEMGGLTEKASQPARTLSGGEQQRLALVRAMAARPEILFLDEPSASLDPSATLYIEQMLDRIREAGTKLVLVTHDIGQARRIAEDVVFFHSGRVLEHAPASEFLAANRPGPAADFLAGRLPL